MKKTKYPLSALMQSLALCISISLLSACANRVAPSGGIKDETPPTIVKSQPQNKALNFTNNQINITFNEFVQLNNPQQEIIISPPITSGKVKYKLKGKTLNIQLPQSEKLKPNTTYTIYIGNAIKDLTEGNTNQQEAYIFSTGNTIDQAQLKGQVKIAKTNENAEENIQVALYPQYTPNIAATDTQFSTQPPLYLTRTKEKGQFNFTNIAPGTYQLLALKDGNSNYYFDQQTESIAFYPQPITITQADSLPTQSYTLQLFTQEGAEAQILNKYNRDYGKLEVQFNRSQQQVNVNNINEFIAEKDFLVTKSSNNDTIIAWYRNVPETYRDINLYIQGINFQDTVKFKRTQVPQNLSDLKHNTSFILRRNESRIELNQPNYIQFTHPIQNYNFNKMLLAEDSVIINNHTQYIKAHPKKPRRLQINYNWQPGKTYQIIIGDSAVVDFYGRYNKSIDLELQAYQKDRYGTLQVKLANYQKGKQYLLQLLNVRKELIKQQIISDSTYTFTYLPPQKYNLRIINDQNNNQKWDTGNYTNRQQPEKIYTNTSPIEIKSGWDAEITLQLPPLE